jgi:hypothetical protein
MTNLSAPRPSALLCALRAFAVKKVDDFAPTQQMKDIKFITKKPAERRSD